MNFYSTGRALLLSFAIATDAEPIEKTVKKATMIRRLFLNILVIIKMFTINNLGLEKVHGSQSE